MNLEKIRRIAVIRNLHIGDVICALPALEALRRGLPHARIAAVVSQQSAPLLEGHPHVDEILLDDYLAPADQLTSVLRSGRFDAVLVTVSTDRNCRAAWRSGIPIRVTHGRRPLQALCGTHRSYHSRKRPPFHEANHILSFTERLGIDFSLKQHRPYLFVDPAQRATIGQRIESRLGGQGPLFAVHPGHRKSAYNWPVENYFETIRRLAGKGRVLITGTQYDKPWLEWIDQRLTPELRQRVFPITDLSLTELVALLSLVDVFVSSSTGPLHIAAIVSRGAVGLYTELIGQHPRRWKPIGPNCSVLSATWNLPEDVPIGSALSEVHMAQITVEMVMERIMASLDERAAA